MLSPKLLTFVRESNWHVPPSWANGLPSFFLSSPYYPLSFGWSFNLSFPCRLVSNGWSWAAKWTQVIIASNYSCLSKAWEDLKRAGVKESFVGTNKNKDMSCSRERRGEWKLKYVSVIGVSLDPVCFLQKNCPLRLVKDICFCYNNVLSFGQNQHRWCKLSSWKLSHSLGWLHSILASGFTCWH